MNTAVTKLTHLLVATIPALVAGCAPLSIEPPTPEKPTLLVLPVELIREAQSASYGFSYAYKIVSNDNSVPPYQARFKLPVKNDMLIVDSLPAGNYTVSRLLTIPVGSGDRTYDNRGRAVNYKFRLVNGKISIFSYSLRVRTYNAIPGRGMETTYSTAMRRTTVQQKNDIVEKLKTLPDFAAWEMLDASTSSSRASVPRKQYVAAEEFHGDWGGIWRPITSAEVQDCIEGKLYFDIDGSRLRGEGVDSAGNRYRISASLIDDGVIRGKLSLNRARLAKVTGKLYDDGTILGSFEYDNNCIAEWKARKN